MHLHDLSMGEGANGSVRSRSSGGSSPPGGEDERSRYERKLEVLKGKLSKLHARQGEDVEDFLSMSHEAEKERGLENNPQMARIKQHFDKKNARHQKDLKDIQAKMQYVEGKLEALDAGRPLDTSTRSMGAVVNSVGQSIKRTGETMKDLSSTVMTAPLELMGHAKHKLLKKAYGGSADNLSEHSTVEGGPAGDSSKVGLSTFYAPSDHDSISGKAKSKSSTLPPGMRMDPSTFNASEFTCTSTPDPGQPVRQPLRGLLSGGSRSGSGESVNTGSGIGLPDEIVATPLDPSSDLLPQLNSQLKDLKTQNVQLLSLCRQLMSNQELLRNEVDEAKAQLKETNRQLEQDRCTAKNYDDKLEATIELHQNENLYLKNEMQHLKSKMDYQYIEKFKQVEEKVERAKNHMERMETSLKDTLDARLRGSARWNGMALSLMNLLIEALKIVLYLIATLLDAVKPLTGSRNRSGLLLCVVFVLLVVIQKVEFGTLAALFSRKKTAEL